MVWDFHSYEMLHITGSLLQAFQDKLTLEDGTDRLSWNVGNCQSMLQNIAE